MYLFIEWPPIATPTFGLSNDVLRVLFNILFNTGYAPGFNFCTNCNNAALFNLISFNLSSSVLFNLTSALSLGDALRLQSSSLSELFY